MLYHCPFPPFVRYFYSHNAVRDDPNEIKIYKYSVIYIYNKKISQTTYYYFFNHNGRAGNAVFIDQQIAAPISPEIVTNTYLFFFFSLSYVMTCTRDVVLSLRRRPRGKFDKIIRYYRCFYFSSYTKPKYKIFNNNNNNRLYPIRNPITDIFFFV